MTNITLTDNEREALEALWRAGGETYVSKMTTSSRHGLLMHRLITVSDTVKLTPAGRALAVDLFTPPLVMPTSEEAVRAWLQARGLWAEGDSIRFDKRFGDLDAIVLQSWLTVEYGFHNKGKYSVTVYKRRISDDAAEAQFRAEFDRACKIARALNASVGKGE